MDSGSGVGVSAQVLTVYEVVFRIRNMALEHLKAMYLLVIPADRRPDQIFMDTLDDRQLVQTLRACLLVYIISRGRAVPRSMQLEAVLATLDDRDLIISSATGSGKTLIMIILQLLRPTELSLLIAPLKRLQHAQLEAFASYGIRSIVINEDTPDDPILWKGIAEGMYSNIITTMEQLGIYDGHMTNFARLLRSSNRQFITRIKSIHIDELQTVYTAGIPKHGQPAFRPAYGQFNTFRLLFSKVTTVAGYSATLPPHILRVAKQKLSIRDHLFIARTSNRPNIMYATHPIVGNLSDFRNLRFVIPINCTDPNEIPVTIIFHDDIKQCADAALYLESLLSPALRGTDSELVKHYHSHMSDEYLEKTYQDFQTGRTRVLHTCAGMESGIDFNRAATLRQPQGCKPAVNLFRVR